MTGCRPARGVSGVALLLGLIASSQPAMAQAPVSAILVMPFESAGAPPALSWMSEGSALLLADALERYGGRSVARRDRVSAFERLQLPPAAALSHATVIKVAQFVSSPEVVIGSFAVAGDQMTVKARLIRLDTGQLMPDITEQGPLPDLFGIFDRAARRLREAKTAAPAQGPGLLSDSPAAFELYVKGLTASSASAQRTFLEQAAKAAPADDRVRLALWEVHDEAGDHERALVVALEVSATSLHAAPARYLAARSQLELKRFDAAFATLTALERKVASAEVMNALGVVQLRRGVTPASGRAVYYFNQAAQANGIDADYFFNLGYGYWLDKDPQAAIYWLREALRREPADGDAHFVLSVALQQTGAVAEATRERELARRLSSAYDRADTVPRNLERLKPYLDSSSTHAGAVIASSEQRDHAELSAFHLQAARRAFDRGADREAEQELRRALYLSPYLADAHVLLGRVQLRGGRAADAIQAFKIALWSEETASSQVWLAHAYLAVQNLSAAREAVARALALDPTAPEARALRVKIGQ